MKIKVLHFAHLAEASGCNEEVVEMDCAEPFALFNYLKQKYQWKVEQKSCSLAINHQFASWTTPLQNEDTVVFMTPFAGG